MSYRELRQTLREGRKLRGFPLVDSPDQMVLLGRCGALNLLCALIVCCSVQRAELISAIERQLSRERRVAAAAARLVLRCL